MLLEGGGATKALQAFTTIHLCFPQRSSMLKSTWEPSEERLWLGMVKVKYVVAYRKLHLSGSKYVKQGLYSRRLLVASLAPPPPPLPPPPPPPLLSGTATVVLTVVAADAISYVRPCTCHTDHVYLALW